MMMITPETWFTLYVLAQEGAMQRGAVLTTRRVGELLNVSQQTASRRITYCLEEGYITRIHTANGMIVEITDKGRKELRRVRSGLEMAFTPREDEIIIEGSIVHGLGEGAYYVDMYSSRFETALGFAPFSGTLNVKIRDESSRQALNRMKQSPPLIVPGFTHEGRTFGDVVCYRVLVNQKVEGAIVIAQRTHHGQNILEVISPFNLRRRLKLKDDDSITLTLIPLHLAK
jgi:riboflavin kinase